MFNSKKRLFLLSLLLIVLFLPLADFSSAAPARGFEIKYPSLPGSDFPSKPLLPEYIKYIFSFSIWIAGLIAFGALVYGGMRYLTSAGSPGAQREGRDQIFAGILGLALLLGSILLLNTINPKILTSNPIKTVNWGGIVIFGGKGCGGEGIALSISSADTQRDFGIVPMSFQFTADVPKDVLIVVGYPKENYEPYDEPSGVYTSPGGLACRDFTPFARSVMLSWQYPGVILTDNDARPTIQELLINKTLFSLTDFSNKADAVHFNKGAGLSFGAILHDYENQKGECSVILEEASDLSRYVIQKNRASSITVFLQNTGPLAGGGVTLYEYENENKAGAVWGPFSSTAIGDKTRPCFRLDDKGFNDKTRSIRVDAGYMAVLFDNYDCTSECQVFIQSDPNLNNDPIGRCCDVFAWGCHPCTSAVMILPLGGSGGAGGGGGGGGGGGW